MEQQDPKSTINPNIKDDDVPFDDASDSFQSDHSHCISSSSSISDVDNTNLTSSIPEQTSKEISPSPSFNDFVGFDNFDNDPHGSTMFTGNDCKNDSNTSDIDKSTSTSTSSKIRTSSNSVPSLVIEETNDNSSSITSINDDDTRMNDESTTTTSPNSGSNFLLALAGLMTKLIGIQLNVLLTSITFPIWLAYYSYIFMIDPYTILRRTKHYFQSNLSRILSCLQCILSKWIKKHESTWKLCLRIAWGLLWSIYIGFILTSLLVFALIISGIILKFITEEPIQITEQLHFDYTKDSPTAFVPLTSCPESTFLECSGPIKPWYNPESRIIPLDHIVFATVSLTLPESYYNRNLGIFQVRIDFLSSNGEALASSRQPCMLHFKSQPLRLMLTFLNLAPLVSGYLSESQTLNIKFNGYTQRNVATSCLRVILEQRAEFTRGAGVPEIYEAYLKLESQQPFLKRILWSWKGVIYVWVTTMVFVIQLLFVLVCCSPILMPSMSSRGVSVNNNGFRTTHVGPK